MSRKPSISRSGLEFADILPTNCLAPGGTTGHPQIRNPYRWLTGKHQMLSGGTGWDIGLLTFNQSIRLAYIVRLNTISKVPPIVQYRPRYWT